jgi:lysophospholipase L1-like esterase
MSVARAQEDADQRVLVIGDSVMLGAQDALLARLATTGWQATPVLAESLHAYDAPGIVDAQRAAIGDAVVVSLGTNDGMTPDQFAGWIDGLMERLRDVRRVYWVNLRPFADWVPAANAEIDAARERWPNLRVIDWSTQGADPALVYADGFHLNDAGRAAMAELVGSTLDGFAQEPRTTTTQPPTTTTTAVTTASTRTAAGGGATSSDVANREDNTLVVVGLIVVALLGIGLLAVGWARRPRHPRGRHSPRGRFARPPVHRRSGARPPSHRPRGGQRRSR